MRDTYIASYKWSRDGKNRISFVLPRSHEYQGGMPLAAPNHKPMEGDRHEDDGNRYG